MSPKPLPPRALVANMADEEQVKSGAAAAKTEAERDAEAWRAVLGTVDGRRVLWKVLAHCGVHATPYALEPVAMAFKVGKQDVGHFLTLSIETADSEALFQMMRENTPRESNGN